ncbi:hypothetical protein AB0C33_01855 [Nonomuraea sp. NPDC048881]|uniref:hypothetical protein n=1 Tax=Nonomuraea sp. NPDC048881 TaxID=3155030 RepID=UPI0033DB7C97
MARIYHSSNARETTLSVAINASATTISVDTPVGYPATTPFVIIVDLGTSSEEIMLVTAVAGANWTVDRGYDNSTALSHDIGAKIVHGVAASEIDDANAHINATTNIHGLTGGAALVGTTTAQTLSNKTLTTPTINGGTISGGTISNATLASPVIGNFSAAQHTHTDAASGGAINAFEKLRMFVVGSMSVVPDTQTDVSFATGTFTYNVGPLWSAAKPTRILCPKPGIYQINVSDLTDSAYNENHVIDAYLVYYAGGAAGAGITIAQATNAITSGGSSQTFGLWKLHLGVGYACNAGDELGLRVNFNYGPGASTRSFFYRLSVYWSAPL